MDELRLAILSDDSETVQAVLSRNPELLNVDQYFNDDKLVSPLCQAVWQSFATQSTAMVKLLLELGADVGVCNRQYLDLSSETPLTKAARLGGAHCPLLEILLQCDKIDHELESKLSYTALYYAAKRGDVELVRTLVNKGHDVNWLCDGFNTALHAAASEGHSQVIRFLLKNGADVTPNSSMTSPLHAAVRGGHRAAAEILVEHGCDINEVNSSMLSPLMMACACGYVDLVKYLLDKGADISICRASSPFHSSPLSIAAFHGQVDMIRLLLKYGADINGENDWLVTPLHIAAEQLDNVETTEVLIQNGANLNGLDSWNRSPLICALLHAAEMTVFLLIKHGADVCEQSVYHPLHCAYITFGVGVKTLENLLLAGCYTSEDRYWFDLAKLETDMITSSEELKNDVIGEVEFTERKLKCNWLKKYLTTPLSLQDICRMEVRKNLVASSKGRDIIPIVNSLPITRPVKRHLSFET